MSYGPAAGAPPAWPPPPPWSPSTVPPVSGSRDADLAALPRIRWAALISIVGAALGVAFPLALSASGYFRITIPTAGSTLSVSQTAVYLVLGVAAVGLAITVVSLWFYREGFLALRPVDTRFSSSPTFALLAIIGLLFVLPGLVLVLVEVLQVLSCAITPTMIPASCVSLGGFLAGAALVLLGAVLLLVGYIGTLVAIWRLGDRYGDSLFKIGAVMLIIPFLSIVGQILILVGASHAESQVRQRPATPYAPSFATGPPPPYR